jgi:DDE superfamily endonuclease
MWVPPETKDPVLLHHPTRQKVGYFGAVRVRDGKFFFRRETGKFNAVTCWQFLKALHAISTRGARRVVVIADNARLHRDWRQEKAEHFALDFLPPYSPELNPRGSGNSLVGFVCITATFPSWTRSLSRSRPNSPTGLNPMTHCAGYAQLLKTLSLEICGLVPDAPSGPPTSRTARNVAATRTSRVPHFSNPLQFASRHANRGTQTCDYGDALLPQK